MKWNDWLLIIKLAVLTIMVILLFIVSHELFGWPK